MATKKVNKSGRKALRNGLIQARVTVKEHQEILTKARLYANGNESAYVRMACLGFRPIKKVELK